MTLLSWNVLAQTYLVPERYPNTASQDAASLPRHLRMLKYLTQDIICLQEAEPDLHTFLTSALPQYDVHFMPKLGKPDGLITAIRKTLPVLSVVECYYPDSSGYGTQLTMLDTPTPTIIATTHLKWDPPEKAHHAGEAQARSLLSILATFDTGVVVVGDFNQTREGSIRTLFVDGGYTEVRTPSPTFHYEGTLLDLDVILSKDVDAQELPHLLPTLDIPSRSVPSDHVPVSALLRF